MIFMDEIVTKRLFWVNKMKFTIKKAKFDHVAGTNWYFSLAVNVILKLCSHYTGKLFEPTRKAIQYSSITSCPICDSPVRAAQLLSVTEIAPKSPFLCVNRSPILFRVSAKAIRYSVDITQKSQNSLKQHLSFKRAFRKYLFWRAWYY